MENTNTNDSRQTGSDKSKGNPLHTWMVTSIVSVSLLAPAGVSAAAWRQDAAPPGEVALELFRDLGREYQATIPTTATRTDPDAIQERMRLYAEMVEVLEQDESLVPFATAEGLRYQAANLGVELRRPREARELARENFNALVAHTARSVASPSKTAGLLAAQAWIVRYGLKAVEPPFPFPDGAKGLDAVLPPYEVLEDDHRVVAADIREYLTAWHDAVPVDHSMITPGFFHRTLLFAGDYLRRSGQYKEAAAAYIDAAELAREVDDIAQIPTMNPAYCTALAAVAYIEDGNLDAARAAVGEIPRMPDRELVMRGLGRRSVAFYLDQVLHKRSSAVPAGSQSRLDLVMPWIEQNTAGELDRDVVSLISWVGTYASNQKIAEGTADAALHAVNFALSKTDTLAALDRAQSEHRVKRLAPGTEPAGYILEPWTASLVLSQFRLAKRIGDIELATMAAKRYLTEYSNSPSLNLVAPWYQRRMQSEVSP